MALPTEPTDEAAARIRRAVVVFALWVARVGARDDAGRATVDAAERDLAPTAAERADLAAYAAASQRFSFLDRRAANWCFGQIVAREVGRAGDWSTAAPAAAWAIHAIRAADEASQ